MGDFYASCMDEAGIEALGTKPIASALARIEALSSKRELFELLGQHEASGLPTLFRFGSAPDLHDSKQTIASLGQGGIGLPDRDDYSKDDAKSKEKREKYLEHVPAPWRCSAIRRKRREGRRATVHALETALANAHLERVAMRDPKNRDNPMSLDELKRLAPAYDWDAYLGETGAPAFTQLNLEPAVLREDERGRGGYPARQLEDVSALAPGARRRALLGAGFVERTPLLPRVPEGPAEIEPRWKRCVQATDRALGDALGQLYVEKTFGADGKGRMKKMIEALTAALREDIAGLPWMTAETKPRALAKLAAFGTDKVGYPDQWKDYSTVDVKRDDYLGNALRAQVFEIRRSYARIDKPTDRTLWGMTPPTVNAYYRRPTTRSCSRPGSCSRRSSTGHRRRRELRRHRRRDRPRVHARLRRPGEQVRRRRQLRELVDRRRPQGVRGAHGLHRRTSTTAT